jgi:hypothetical protein
MYLCLAPLLFIGSDIIGVLVPIGINTNPDGSCLKGEGGLGLCTCSFKGVLTVMDARLLTSLCGD